MIKNKLPVEVQLLMKKHKEWIELFPLAVNVGASNERPILVLQDKEKNFSLPVWLGSLDAAAAMVQASSTTLDSTPHRTTQNILRALKTELKFCLFQELVGHNQFVDLVLSGTNEYFTVRSRADESMSICLLSQARFFCPLEIIKKSRDMETDLKTAPVLNALSAINEPRTTELLN
jgi:hypothetical protein